MKVDPNELFKALAKMSPKNDNGKDGNRSLYSMFEQIHNKDK